MNPAGARPGRIAVLMAAALALSASLLLLGLPVYQGMVEATRLEPSAARAGAGSGTQATLLEVNGPWAVVVLLIPIAVATGPLLLLRRVRWRTAVFVSTVLLSILVVISGFSVGVFYAPSALALGIAALLELRSGRAAAEPAQAADGS
jgi:hypothetical protein